MTLKVMGKMLLGSIAALALTGVAPVWAADEKVEVIHNMASPSQQPAVSVLINAYKERGGSWVDSPISGGGTARAAMVNRALAGNPSEVMYVHAKLVFRELTEKGLTTAVKPEGWEKWKDNVPAALWDEMVNDKGEVVITPIIIGLHNVGYFNSAVMKRAGAEVPKTWEDLFPVLDKIKALGDVIPLAVSENADQMKQLMFSIVAGTAGVEVYNQIYVKLDPEGFKTDGFRKAAETLRRLKPYTDLGRTARVWQDAGDMVAKGQAGVLPYGTFALEAFLGAGFEPGKDFECTNFGGIAILAPNGFMYGRPDNEQEQASENLFAAMVMDPKVQEAFVKEGGGIPSRTDASPDVINKCMQDVRGGLLDAKTNVKDPSMTMPGSITGATQDVIVEFWADDNMSIDTFIEKMQTAIKPL